MSIIRDLLILSVVVFFVAKFLPNIRVKHFGTAILVAVVYSALNLLFGWLLELLTLPLMFFTAGLFKIVLNALMLFATDLLLKDFKIKGFKTILLAAAIITVAGFLIDKLL